MPRRESSWTEERLERAMGRLLRVGVLLSGAVVTAGGVLYLLRHGSTSPHYGIFDGEPSDLRRVPGILREAASLRGRGLIQLGLLLLVATPVARVLFSVVAFAVRRDLTYTAVALLVLAILVYCLSGGPL